MATKITFGLKINEAERIAIQLHERQIRDFKSVKYAYFSVIFVELTSHVFLSIVIPFKDMCTSTIWIIFAV